MMNARMLAGIGAPLFSIGYVKAMTHTPQSDPFAAFWCRTPGLEEAAPALASLSGHCWGCPVALAGAALLAMSVAHARARSGRARA